MPAVACFAALTAAAGAQSYPTLHVDALSMRADKARVDVGETFHLAIHVRVRERVRALDELVIPGVGTMHVLGDERHVTAGPHATDVTETLTLEAVDPGRFTFTPAYLDAIDATTHKPSRFSANPVTVIVAGKGAVPVDSGSLWISLRTAVAWLLGIVVLFAVALWLGARWLRASARAAAPAYAVPAMQAAPAAPPRTPRDDVADALRTYRTAPAAESLLRLRGALHRAAGASPGATLRDTLAATSDAALRSALTAADHAAFGPAAARDAASVELIAMTEMWLQ